MADDDELNLDDTGSSGGPAKKGGLGSFLPNVLKWVIIGICAVILIVVICLICIKIYTNNKTGDYNPATYSEEYKAVGESYDWYKSIDTIQVFTNDDPPATVRVTVFLGYKKDDKSASADISSMAVEIKSFIRKYFRGKSAAELKNAENETKFQIEIKNAINDRILSTSKIKAVNFDQLDVVDPN
ncbi:MAG: flagellar basal body-associated FliL family protein [Treponema sp.]|nr:flagellar basal body-associated FliL family protein [Treponema sp.]